MKHLLQNCSRTAIVRALGRTAAAVLSVAVLCQPNLASAAPRGGGGGGGFHGGGGFPWRRIRVPRGGFHAGGFHAAAFITEARLRRRAHWRRRPGSLVSRLAQRTLWLVVG